MKNFINFLPPWVETNIQPAFYDKQSGTCIQQTARMYAKVNQLVRIANEQYETIQDYINQFLELKDYVEDYFDNLDVQEEINNKLDEMVESGEFAEIVGQLLVNKYDYYEITDQSESEFVDILNSDRYRLIVLENDYTFTSQKNIKGNFVLDLNGHTLTFDVPSANEDWENSHGFFNFLPADTPLGYEGKGNITIKNGTIEGGNLSFAHAKNIRIENVSFVNCQNNHALEMCAIDGLTVENCTFEGIQKDSSGEYLQIENATYTAFPFFDSEDNATYDETPCRDVTVNNCDFIEPSDDDYHFASGVGTHSGDIDSLFTENVTISNCTFNKAKYRSIQLYRINKLNINNCIFNGESTIEGSVHIRLRNGINTVSIENCSFKGQVRAIETAREYGEIKSVTIANNFFEDYNSADYSTHGIIELHDPISTNINNNHFKDFIQFAIYTLQSDTYVSAIEHDITIDSNYFEPLHDATNSVIRVGVGKNFITNNTFNTDNHPSTVQIVSSSNTAESFYAKGNLFSNNAIYDRRDIYDASPDAFKNTYDVQKSVWSGNNASVTYLSNEFSPFSFNTIILTIGGDTWTQVVKLKPYLPVSKFDIRTFMFPVSNSAGSTLEVAKFAIASDGTMTYTSTNGNLRRIMFTNE